jgi:hypothetical protein
MSLVLFNAEQNISEIEKFKLLPNELQDSIADYTEEGYNLKCFNYNWYNIIETIGYHYGWEYLIDFLNKHLTEKIIGPLKITNCKHMIGYCDTCVEFITCDEKLSVGFYYDYIKMHPGKKYFLDDEMVDNKKATKLIMNKIDEYINSNRYNPDIMYKINKKLLDSYYFDTDFYETDSDNN